MKRFRYWFIGLILVAAACGGGGGGGGITPPTPGPTATPTAVPTPTMAPTAGSISVGSSGATQTIGTVGSVGQATLGLSAPTAGSGTTITFAASATAPSGIAPLDAQKRTAQSTNTGLWYLTLAPSQTVTFASTPTLTIALTSVTPGVTYYLAFFDPTSGSSGAWTEPWGSAGTVSGSTVSFAATSLSYTLTANKTYYIALYTTATATPSPSPTPTASPSPTPTASPSPTPTASPSPTPTASTGPTASPAALSANPTSLSLGQTGAASFTVTEAGYRGTYTVTSSNTGVVSVTSPVTSSSDTTTININATNNGSSNVTVRDASGQTVVVPVDVTVAVITVQGSHRR